MVVAASTELVEGVIAVSFPTTGVEVAIISGVEVATIEMVVASSGVDDATEIVDVEVPRTIPLPLDALGFENEESRESQVLPRLPGIA